MKTLGLILIMATICNMSCYAQNERRVTDESFQRFLDRFETVAPPLNYKKITDPTPIMTREEAIRFLHRTDAEMEFITADAGYDGSVQITRGRRTAECDFKYLLNDSIYILCTRESAQEMDTTGRMIDITRVYLNVFTMQGERINRHLVGEQFTYEDDWVSFVLFDKNHIRIFYYNRDDTRIEDGYHSTVYYLNYTITGDGQFIQQNKSDVIYLREFIRRYGFASFGRNPDDPMNEFDF